MQVVVAFCILIPLDLPEVVMCVLAVTRMNDGDELVVAVLGKGMR